MIEIDNTNGRKWARFWLIVTLVVSVIANVTHSVLAESVITLWLRVPGGIIWPTFTFAAIEIVIRIVWRRSLSHYLARAMILGPAIPAIVTSYSHQQDLLGMMGEGEFISAIGPAAIDGLMIGCTLALLFTRPLPAIPTLPAETEEESPSAVSASADLGPSATPAIEPRPSGSLDKAIDALKGGASTTDAVSASGLSAPTVRRYAAVVRALKDNPHAPIDARKLSVRPDAVDSIRAWARLESVR